MNTRLNAVSRANAQTDGAGIAASETSADPTTAFATAPRINAGTATDQIRADRRTA